MTHWIAVFTLWSCAAEESDRFRIQRIDGESIESPLQAIDAEGKLFLGNGNSVASDQVVSLECLNARRPPWPTESHLSFLNGDRLVGVPLECDQRTISLNSSLAKTGPIKVPLSRVESIWFAPSTGSRTASSNENPKRDRVIMRNGDQLSGTLAALLREEKILKIEIDMKPKSIPVDQIASIQLNSELRSDRVPDSPYWQCLLRNGTRISLRSVKLTNGSISGTTLFKSEVHFPLSDLVAMEQIQGKSIWLSSLKPALVELTPYLIESPRWYLDRNPLGMQLALQTATGPSYFDRGLCITSKTNLTYSLEGRYEWFFAEVGIDPQLGREGNVDLKLSLDGKAVELSEFKRLTLKQGIVPVRLKLSGAKQFSLEVDWGEGGPVGDVVNWGRARVIQK